MGGVVVVEGRSRGGVSTLMGAEETVVITVGRREGRDPSDCGGGVQNKSLEGTGEGIDVMPGVVRNGGNKWV